MNEILILPSGKPALAMERRMIVRNCYALPKLASQIEDEVREAMLENVLRGRE